MPYPVTELINYSFYNSGIVSRDFETVSGPQLNDGLSFLNDILGEKTSTKSLIPYFSSVDFTTVQGQEIYFIPNLVEATSIVFFLASVRYSMFELNRDAYFGLPRAENIESLPFNYHVERAYQIPNPPLTQPVAGCNIYIYFLPNQAYPMTIWGKFGLLQANYNDDLSLFYDRFYINYLKYALTERLCDEYNYQVPPRISKQLLMFEKQISKKSAILDLRLKKISTLSDVQVGLNYAQVNLGHGWITS